MTTNSYLRQHTVAAPMTFSGKGLHTGVKVTMTVNPAPADHGIVFRRVDLEGQPTIPALCQYVTDTSRGTTIEINGVRVSTIEHIVSALWTMGCDNALIDIDNTETPIMDGSAREYAEAIEATGIVEQQAFRTFYEVRETKHFSIPEKGVKLAIYPYSGYGATVMVEYNSKVVGHQYADWLQGGDYKSQIAPCRTFCFLHELEPLFKMNLIKGGDLDNAIVVVEHAVSDEQIEHLKGIFGKEDIRVTGGYLNNLELRATNEIARHKLLDLLGDFALLGMRIKGRVFATRPGHYANTEFMKQITAEGLHQQERPLYSYDPNAKPLLDLNDIKALLPHRHPFIMVDRVFHLDDSSIGCIKNLTANESYFEGHFPSEPIMPGVLVLESMAQAGAIIVLNGMEDKTDCSTYFMKIKDARFLRKVVPGDTLHIECRLTAPLRHNVAQLEAKAFVGKVPVCHAEFVAQIVKNNK